MSAARILAQYLTGHQVAHHSVMLGLPEQTYAHRCAKEFFELRAAFGVRGYEDEAQALARIHEVFVKEVP